jgi:hypothetical protein
MTRVLLTIAILVLGGNPARSNNLKYPALTRETLVGTWEGVVGIGAAPVFFHILIRLRNEDYNLAEIYSESLDGRVYRLQICTITDANVYLRFHALPGGGNSEWWIEGEGYGDAKKAWINGRIGTGFDARDSGGSFYLAKGTWVRNFGEASRRGEEKITEVQAGKK